MKDYMKLDVFAVEKDGTTRTYEEWEADYIALKAEGKKCWEATGLADDIRAGWQKAAKENKLFAFGPYSVPLDVVEAIEEDTRHMLACAGIVKKHPYEPDPDYVKSLKDKARQLEEEVRAKQKQIDTLLSLVADLKKVDAKEEQCRLAGVDDEIELF